MSTGQHSDAFTSSSHPASATGQSPWTEATDIYLVEGLLVQEGPSARGPSTAFPFPSLIDPQIFATTQFEGPLCFTPEPFTRLLKGWVCAQKYLPPTERPGSTASRLPRTCRLQPKFLRIASSFYNLEEFHRLVSATLTELYPVYARYAPQRNITVERLLEISHLVVRNPSHILNREPPAPQPPTPSSLIASAHPLPQPAEVFKMLQLLDSKFAEASASTKPLLADTCAADTRSSSSVTPNASGTQLPPTFVSTVSGAQAPPFASATTSGTARPHTPIPSRAQISEPSASFSIGAQGPSADASAASASASMPSDANLQ